MRILFTIILLVVSTMSTCAQTAQEVTLKVSNPSEIQRQEVIEADYQKVCQQLQINKGDSFVVYNGFGQEQTYQVTYDGKLLLDVAVQPRSTAVFTIAKGTPKPFRLSVFGRVYPERDDDLTWENDRGIYRMYGPALQRSGQKAYGTDVWLKNTPELVLEERYRLHLWGVGLRDSLYRAKQEKAAHDIYVNTSFHHDHGYGMDCYEVGPSLGCGTPALMRDGQLIYPYCWNECTILDNGPLRFTAELTYNTTADGITEHRRVSLDKGAHFNRMTVWYDGIKMPTTLAAGVVLHSTDNYVAGKDYVQYADPTDNPKVHQSQIYVATLFPEGVDKTMRLEGTPNNAIGMIGNYMGKPYIYYFGSAWSKYDIQTQAQWQLCIDEQLQNFRHPLEIIIEQK